MKVLSWGSNSHGQLAQNSHEEQSLTSVPIKSPLNIKLISGGGKHTILVTTEGEIHTCGDNDKGQLGKDLKIKLLHSFQPISSSYKITKVSCGWDFNLALTDAGEVLGWGSNSFGQLGLSVDKVSYLISPTKVFDKKTIDIGAGLRHSGVVTFDGLVFTSGFGRKGQLGFCVNKTSPNVIDRFTEVETLENCVEISCGENHSIVKTKEGKIFSWGNNKHGQLGVDPKEVPSVNFPIKVDLEVGGSKSIHSGWAHNLILTEKHEVITWGRNDLGQLGEERNINWKPQVIEKLKKVKQVCAGSHHCLVLTEDNIVFTWGWNEHGNCGNGDCTNLKEPYKVIENVQLIGCGYAHCFVTI